MNVQRGSMCIYLFSAVTAVMYLFAANTPQYLLRR